MTSSSQSEIDPDDVCGICNTKREDHGDRNHQFNIDGDLIPLAPPPKARNTPPQERGQVSASAQQILRDPLTGPTLRLVEILIQKQLLDGADVLFIFGGEPSDSSDRGQAGK